MRFPLPLPRSARVPLAIAATAGVLAGIAVLVQANILADIFSGHVSTIAVVLLLAVIAARAGLTWLLGASGQRAATTVHTGLRARLLRHVSGLGPGWLGGQRAGELTTLATKGLDAIDPYVRDYLPQLVIAAVVPVAVLVQLAVTDPVSAVVVGVTLPLIPVFAALAGMRAKAATDRQWAELARLGGHFLDVVAGLPTLATFGRASAHARTVRDMADRHRTATMRTLRLAFLSSLTLELVATLSVALVAVPIALRLLDSGLDLRTALLVLLILPEAYLPLRVAGQRFHAAAEALTVGRRVAEILGTPPPAARGARPVPRGAAIVLDGVTVRYPDRSEPALREATLTVRPGEWTGIAGPSGAGKSTILGLLLGFVVAERGTVTIGGVEPDQSLRGRLAWLPQRPHLFAGTVADNIRFGILSGSLSVTDSVTDDEIRSAAALAGADEFVAALPDGYRTELGERGARLSTGQRQRIALARLILRVRRTDPEFVLLDEPTAGLDLATERTVAAALRGLLAGRTVLAVAHRPAVLDLADRVVVVRAGRPVEVGGLGMVA